MNVPTTTHDPVYKEILPGEMMRLRTDEGLSNIEIAERCGVSPVTVRKYIGPQGFRKSAPTPPLETKPEKAPSQKRLLSITEQTLVGAIASYVLSPKQGAITIKAPTVDAMLSFKDAVLFVEEFQEALMKMTEMEAQ